MQRSVFIGLLWRWYFVWSKRCLGEAWVQEGSDWEVSVRKMLINYTRVEHSRQLCTMNLCNEPTTKIKAKHQATQIRFVYSVLRTRLGDDATLAIKLAKWRRSRTSGVWGGSKD